MPISMRKRFSYALVLIATLAIGAVSYTVTVQAGPSVRTVQLRDDCDPATFNVAVGPGACVGNGDTAFPDFIAEVLAQGSADKWRMNPDRSEADAGAMPQNRGGETHSFTEVKHFGGGIIPVLNGGMPPVDECAVKVNGVPVVGPDGNFIPSEPQTFVPAGMSGATQRLAKGTHTFQCCIHPWMHSTITVR
jgi:hypothetical protein